MMLVRVAPWLVVCMLPCCQVCGEEMRTDDGFALRVSERGAADALVGGATTFRPSGGAQSFFRIRELGSPTWTNLLGTFGKTRFRLAADQLGIAGTGEVFFDDVELGRSNER